MGSSAATRKKRRPRFQKSETWGADALRREGHDESCPYEIRSVKIAAFRLLPGIYDRAAELQKRWLGTRCLRSSSQRSAPLQKAKERVFPVQSTGTFGPERLKPRCGSDGFGTAEAVP